MWYDNGTMVVRRPPTPKFGGVRNGGRSARVVDQVLTTTVEMLGEVGYGALRVDEVAARSGVNKTTIYRRWPTKSQLVSAALRHYHVQLPPPDTGDLERDLTEMFARSFSTKDLRITRGVMRMMMVEYNDPELEAIRAEARDRIIALRLPRFEVAVARGELPPSTDIALLHSILASTIHSRLLAQVETPTPAMIHEIVQIMIAGARVRWATTPAGTARARPASRHRARRRA